MSGISYVKNLTSKDFEHMSKHNLQMYIQALANEKQVIKDTEQKMNKIALDSENKLRGLGHRSQASFLSDWNALQQSIAQQRKPIDIENSQRLIDIERQEKIVSDIIKQKSMSLCSVINEHIKNKSTKPKGNIVDLFSAYCNNYIKNEKYANNSSTPLIVACREKLEHDALLLSLTEDVNAVDNKGWTALHYACKNKMTTVALSLIDRGADAKIIAPAENGYTALFRACVNNMNDVALALLDKSDVDAICSAQQADLKDKANTSTALIECCAKKMYDVALKILDVENLKNVSHANGVTALSWACYHNMRDVALKIMDYDPKNWGYVLNNGWTALHWALTNNMLDIVNLFFTKTYYYEDNADGEEIEIEKDNGLNVPFPDDGYTPLCYIIRNADYYEDYFIPYCAKFVNSTRTSLVHICNDGNTALILSSTDGYIYNNEYAFGHAIMNELDDDNNNELDKNIIIGHINKIGNTALLCIFNRGHQHNYYINRLVSGKITLSQEAENLAVRLIESGYANPHIKDSFGYTALDYARFCNMKKVIYLLDPAGHILRGIGPNIDAEAVEEIVKYTRGGKKTKNKTKRRIK